jgi:hypothetical protein
MKKIANRLNVHHLFVLILFSFFPTLSFATEKNKQYTA